MQRRVIVRNNMIRTSINIETLSNEVRNVHYKTMGDERYTEQALEVRFRDNSATRAKKTDLGL